MCLTLASLTMVIHLNGMTKWMLLALCAMILTLTACKSPSGSREYIPGRGWKSN